MWDGSYWPTRRFNNTSRVKKEIMKCHSPLNHIAVLPEARYMRGPMHVKITFRQNRTFGTWINLGSCRIRKHKNRKIVQLSAFWSCEVIQNGWRDLAKHRDVKNHYIRDCWCLLAAKHRYDIQPTRMAKLASNIISFFRYFSSVFLSLWGKTSIRPSSLKDKTRYLCRNQTV